MIDCNEWRTEKRHECANMVKVKRLELWWQLYSTSLPFWDLENFRPMDFCWHECTSKLELLLVACCQLLLIIHSTEKHDTKFAVFCNNSMSCVRPSLFVFLLRILAYRNARNCAICIFGLLVTVVKEAVVLGRPEITEWRMEGCVGWRAVLVYKMLGEVEVEEKYWKRIIILFMAV